MAAAIETETPTATFISVRRSARFVYLASYETFDARGRQHTTPGITIEFKDGRYDVGPDTQRLVEKYNRATDGDPLTVQNIIDFLRRHELNGDGTDGFFEVDVPAPDPQPEILAIARAAASLDAATVNAILEAERNGFQRETVIATAQGALEQMTVEIEAQNEAKVAATPTKAAAAAKAQKA